MLKIAAITQVKDEAVLLPIWLRHYGGQVGYRNLFVIDDRSSDGSTTQLNIGGVFRRDLRPFDEIERALEISLFVQELLRFYDWVIYTDVDELLILDPVLSLPLSDYLQRMSGNHLNAVGINLLQHPNGEGDYTSDSPVLTQRKFGALARGYFKQLVHRAPARFAAGFHWTNRSRNYAPGLYLLHLAFFDRETTRKRWMVRNKIQWSEAAMEAGHGAQFRVPGDEFVEERFRQFRARFASVAPAAQFEPAILAFLKRVEAERTGEDTARLLLAERTLPLLQFPARFENSIKAVNAPLQPEEVAAQTQHAFASEFDAEAVYRHAVSLARSIGAGAA